MGEDEVPWWRPGRALAVGCVGRLLAVVLGLLLGALGGVGTPGPAAGDTPDSSLTVSPSTGLNPAGQTVTVTGTGFYEHTEVTIFQCKELDASGAESCSVLGSSTPGPGALLGPTRVVVARSFTPVVGPSPRLQDCATGLGCTVYATSGAVQAHALISFGALAAGTTYVPLSPARLLDTRPGGATVDDVAAAAGPVGPGEARSLVLTGRGGVPPSGVGAVALNITAVAPTTGGFLTVFPTGESRPLASNLNFGPGQTIPNLVVAKVGAGGQVSIYNDTGATQVIADVAGWFPTGSGYVPLSPGRLLDTRPGGRTVDGAAAAQGSVEPGGVRPLVVTGRGGVPASGVGAVVLNITAIDPTAAGFVTVFPTGESRPLASNLNFGAGQTIPNLVVAKVGAGGQVSIYNDTGATQVIADVAGWFPTGPGYAALSPARLLDTRPGGVTVDGTAAGQGSVGPGQTVALKVTGRGGVPPSGVAAVVLNITAVTPSAGGFVTVYPTGEGRPLASNLNFGPGQTIPNLVVAKVGGGGQVSIYNDAGSAHLIADVAGWFALVPG